MGVDDGVEVGVGLGGHISGLSGIRHLGIASKQAGLGLQVEVGVGVIVGLGGTLV